jgi:hypothetical protein
MINLKKIVRNYLLLIFAIAFSSSLESFAQTVWTSRISPELPMNEYKAIAANGTQTIMVGDSGRYLYSGDGINWTKKIMEPRNTLSSIVWTGTQFIAVGYDTINHVAFTSPDGISWTKRKMGTFSGSTPFTIVSGGNQVVAVSENGTFFTSQDGISWVQKKVGENSDRIVGLIWAGTHFLAVGAHSDFDSTIAIVFSSADGLTWKRRFSQTTEFTPYLAWTGKLIVALSEENTLGLNGAPILTSSDGINWTTSQSSGTYLLPNTMVWTGKQLVVASLYGPITSPDGLTWTQQKWLSDEYRFPERQTYTSSINPEMLTWTGKQLIALEKSGHIFTSSDAVNWKSVKDFARPPHLYSVISSGFQNVAVGERGTILSSPDGIIWTEINSGTNQSLRSIIWTSTHFVAVGDSGTILFSTDGLAWTQRVSGIQKSLRAIIWNGNKYVAAGVDGTTLTSSDGISWKLEASFTGASLNALSWNKDQIVVVGEGGVLFTSPDGVTWTQRNSGIVDWFLSITWTGSQFVAIADGGSKQISTSSDGLTWTTQAMGNGITRGESVIWTGSQLVAIAYGRYIPYAVMTSLDGIKWKEAGVPPTLNRQHAITWTGTQFITVGNQKTIFTSPLNLATSIEDPASRQKNLSIRNLGSKLSITLPKDMLGDKTKVSAYAMNGEKVFDVVGLESKEEMVIPIAKLAPGRYLLEVKGVKGKISKSFCRVPF